MDILNGILDFCSSPAGASIGFGLFIISEALASIPAIKANGIFQLVFQVLSRFKRPSTPVLLIILLSLSMTACGKTIDQVKYAAHSIIDIGGKVYEDVTDNAKTAKDLVTPEKK